MVPYIWGGLPFPFYPPITTPRVMCYLFPSQIFAFSGCTGRGEDYRLPISPPPSPLPAFPQPARATTTESGVGPVNYHSHPPHPPRTHFVSAAVADEVGEAEGQGRSPPGASLKEGDLPKGRGGGARQLRQSGVHWFPHGHTGLITD